MDVGALLAEREEVRCLHPIGVSAVEGEFDRGELVSCIGPDGAEVARGLANYGAHDTTRILRTPSSAIESRLGYVHEPELIHRDNLVLL
jgi:glutamate 5-kinase